MRTCYIKTILVISYVLSGIAGASQVIDHTSTYRSFHQNKYFRISYDNDFFRNADLYYTQGLVFEYVHPVIKKFPLTKLLYKTSNCQPQYGLTLEHWGYTPDNTSSSSAVEGDRPYSACLALKIFSISTDTLKRTRIASAISAGVIGPAAGGKELQTAIHNLINDAIPRGWDNQVRNNLILNYRLNIEKELMKVPERLLLNFCSELRLGTLDDRISGGLNMMAGNFEDPFGPLSDGNNRIRYFFFSEAKIHLVGYNASLEGGIFDKRSPYTISSHDVSRIRFQWDAGIGIQFHKLYAHFSQTFITKEFRGCKTHHWGGIGIGWKL